ncbi:MAG TPA: dienelactone hydrolase family protein [Magnetospirillaceae bacterium]
MAEITVKAADGGQFSAYVAAPKSGKGPGVVIIQEIFGVNSVMRQTADAYAAQGYTAICPDLFWRLKPGIQLDDKTQMNEALELLGKVDQDKAVDDIKATLGALRSHPACTGKAGAVGYCLGGRLAYMTAARTDSDCSVGYYGIMLDSLLGEAANIKKPLMLHIAEKDGFVPPPVQAKVKDGLKSNNHVTIHSYANVDHAFARIGGSHFDQTAAELANGRTAAFFKANLGA